MTQNERSDAADPNWCLECFNKAPAAHEMILLHCHNAHSKWFWSHVSEKILGSRCTSHLTQLFAVCRGFPSTNLCTHWFSFHPHHVPGQIFLRIMVVPKTVHHTSLQHPHPPADTEAKTRGVCDQRALWHLNMSEGRNMSMTASPQVRGGWEVGGLREGEERKNNCGARGAQNSRVLRETQMKSLVWLPQLSGACNDFKSLNGNTKL